MAVPPTATPPTGAPAAAPPAAPPAPESAESRTTSTDLSDLLNQLGDGTDGYVAPEAPLTDPRDLERPGDPARVAVGSTGVINYQPEFASFAARAGGWAIDTVITTAALVPGIAMLIMFDGAVRLLAVPVLLICVAVVAWSYTTSIARNGQWIGNRVTSTTVVHVSSGEFLDQPQAFTRFAARALFSPILAAGFIMALTNTSRRTFHDQIAESIVTRPTRASWSIEDHNDIPTDQGPA
jgi:uncharacterized RDD family membrane protein YckC